MLKLTKRPKSPFYVARGTFNGQRVEVSTKCARLADAKVELVQIERRLRASADGPGQALHFLTALDIYRQKKPNARFLDPIERYFGRMLVKDVNNAEMRRARNVLYPAAADATIRRQLYTPVKAILNAAADDDLCPPPRLSAPSGGNRRTAFLLPAQADKLIVALGADQNVYLAPLVTFLIGQGCRMGETLTLDGRDVSLEHRFAIMRNTKNGEERRVTLIPRVVAALSTLRSVGQAGPLFRRVDGAGFRHGAASGGQIAKAFARAVKIAKLDEETITPHVCRHTWATWFYAQTKDVRRLQDEGGWKSGEWQRYTKIGTPDLGRSARKMGWDFSELGENWGNEAARA